MFSTAYCEGNEVGPRRQFLCRAVPVGPAGRVRAACYPLAVTSVPEPPAVGQPAPVFSQTSRQGGPSTSPPTADGPMSWCGSPGASPAPSAGSTLDGMTEGSLSVRLRPGHAAVRAARRDDPGPLPARPEARPRSDAPPRAVDSNRRPTGGVVVEIRHTLSYELTRAMPAFDLEGYVGRSRAVDMSAIAWADVPRYPVSAEMVRTLRYMQDVESHTIIYLRSLLATRAVDDPDVATFLACWVYEETFHGLALARFLEAVGSPIGPRARPRGQETLAKRIEAAATAMVSNAWADFCAVHMVWGAINELTTLTGYRRFAAVAGHPVLTDLLDRIVLDESRHFFFYYRQAEIRLRRRGVARVARFLVDRFWAPVGSGVEADPEVEFLATYLFNGPDGLDAARKVDDTIRRLPGFETVQLLEAWMNRHATSQEGRRNGHHNH